MRNAWWRALIGATAALGISVGGCRGLARSRAREGPPPTTSLSTRADTRPTEAQGMDPSRALLPLQSIPPVATMPVPTEDPNREIPSQALKHYLSARELFQAWMNTDAIDELQKALRYDPGSPECHLLLGRAAVRAGNLAQARNHLLEAAKLRPDSVVCQYLLGWLAMGSKDSAEAIRRFRLALACSDAAADRAETILTRYYLGEELFAGGYLSAAIEQLEAFEKAIADPRGSFWQNRELFTLVRSRRARPAVLIGQAALGLHRYAQAAEAFSLALKDDPNDLQIKARYAQALSRSGARDEALKIARGLALTTNQSQAGVELMGWIYKDMGRPRELAAELQRLIAEHPDRSDLGVLLAETLVALGQKGEAERLLRRLIKEHPKLAVTYERLALLLESQGRFSEALHVLSEAVTADPEAHIRALRVVAHFAGRTKTVEEVAARAETLLSGDPKNYALSYVIGVLAYGADRQELAARCLNRAIDIRPDFQPAYLSLGRLHLDRFRWQEAIDVVKRAADAGQKSAALTYVLARGYDGLDKIDLAESAYREVIKEDPKSVLAMVSLGEVYERVGHRNKAQREYQNALRISPGNDHAGERLIRLLLSQGEHNQARDELERFRRAGGSGPAIGRCLAIMASRGEMARYRKLLGDLLNEAPKEVETRYDLATSFYATKDYDKASEQVDEILKTAPGHQNARFLMAELCRKRLDFDGAGKVISGLLREHPNREAWLLAMSEIHLDLQDYAKAFGVMESLLKEATDAQRRRVYQIRLIGAYTAAGEHDRAAAVAEAWLKEDPASVMARRVLIESLQESGRHDRAIQLAKQWVATAPPAPPDKRKDAADDEPEDEEDEGDEKPDAAADLVGRPGTGDPRQASRGLLISAYMAAKQYDRALETLAGWMEADPSNRWLMGQMWFALTGAKRHADAIELVRSILASGKQTQTYRLMLAQSYQKATQYDRALAVLAEVPPGDRTAQADMLEIDILTSAKRFDQAERRAQQIVSRHKDEQARLAYSRMLLVPVYHRIGRQDLAEKEMVKIYAKQPKDPTINNDLGYTWADAGRHLDEAERMLRFALGEEPRSAAYMDSLGWVFYKKGDFQSAERYLSKAVRAQGGQDAVIHDHLGDVFWRLGNKASAAKTWRKAVELSLKEQAEGKEPSDPQTLPRVRAKLSELERGGIPAVAEVVGTTAATSRAAQGGPASAPGSR